MNEKRLALVGAVALVGTSLHWRRRERTIKRSLTASREWGATGTTNGDERAEGRAAREAAEHLDARVEDLPERVTAVDEERRDLRRELDSVRERWADSWWRSWADERSTDPSDDGPPVRVVEFEDGKLDDARALAKRALEVDAITLVLAHGDGSFVVGVGETLSERFNAEEIAHEIANEAGGGAGGTAQLAAGGGATDALSETAHRLERRLRNAGTAGIA